VKTTRVFSETIKAFKAEKKLIVSYGGSSSGKTVSALQLLFYLASQKKDLQIFCFSQTVNKLKDTLIDDFKRYICGQKFFSDNFHAQKYLEFKTGSRINFLSADDPDKFLGVRSDYLLMDEINTYRLGHETFKNLFARCRGITIVTFNPSSKFWITDYMSEDFTQVIHSTFKDNPYIPEQTYTNLLHLSKNDLNFKKVYMDGDWGAMEGLVFKFKENWNYYKDEPEYFDSVYYGLDFGFANDPTAAVQVKVQIKEKRVFIKELLYKSGLLNSQIAEILIPLIGNEWIVADSAEPKSIVSLRTEHNLNTISAVKGEDSVKAGIQRMKEWELLIHEKSGNLINEMFNYSYVDKEGLINKPIDAYNHGIDSIRYIFLKFRL
jgi:phage terminase large subunit